MRFLLSIMQDVRCSHLRATLALATMARIGFAESGVHQNVLLLISTPGHRGRKYNHWFTTMLMSGLDSSIDSGGRSIKLIGGGGWGKDVRVCVF